MLAHFQNLALVDLQSLLSTHKDDRAAGGRYHADALRSRGLQTNPLHHGSSISGGVAPSQVMPEKDNQSIYKISVALKLDLLAQPRLARK